MHMADVLLSPVTGGVMTAVSAGALGYSVRKLSKGEAGFDESKIPMMGVMGAFVFAGQMINFTIPATGSSGHIGGGLLLAAVLGPFPALITLAAVLLIQCLFFADGGLLAYGCNVFNMGVCSVLAYKFIYEPIVRKEMNNKNITIASMAAVVLGLQLGAFSVVLETLASGITELPFGSFALLMQPIHLAIGLVEGVVTAGVLCYINVARPEVLYSKTLYSDNKLARVSFKNLIIVFGVLTVIVGSVLSLFASGYPDGLEWSVEGVAGTAELASKSGLIGIVQNIVSKTAFMPDYGFADGSNPVLGTSVAGIIGSLITVIIAGGIAFLVSRRKHAESI
ncbi:MAG: energy-coupling factor ABC transporter permease [Clostridiales bacterium]|jgi:cobalt/nickel transport system permease protein|nr:energy-coupling factor ABC transporter permease [Clostridiales bacterium]